MLRCRLPVVMKTITSPCCRSLAYGQKGDYTVRRECNTMQPPPAPKHTLLHPDAIRCALPKSRKPGFLSEILRESLSAWLPDLGFPAIAMVSACLIPVCIHASETYIIKDISVTASSYWGLTDQDPQNLVNGSGLSKPIYELDSGVVLSRTISHDYSPWASRQWHTSNNDFQPWVRFDFENSHNLSSVYVWNANQNNLTSRGVKTFDIQVSTDGGASYATARTGVTLPQAIGNTDIYATAVDLSSFNGVTNVIFNIRSNYGGDCSGLSEVQFIAKGPSELAVIADSKKHFSNIQGAFGWRYGYYTDIYSPSGFMQMTMFQDGVWVAGPPTYTGIGNTHTHPNGWDPHHWAVRRWQAWTSGRMRIDVFLEDGDSGTNSNGQRILVYHGDSVIASRITPARFSDQKLTAYCDVKGGDIIDVALDPLNVHPWEDSVRIVAQVSLEGPDSKLFPRLDLNIGDSTVQLRWPLVCDHVLQESSRPDGTWNPINDGISHDDVFYYYSAPLNRAIQPSRFFRLANDNLAR